jgi:hypothetical protein
MKFDPNATLECDKLRMWKVDSSDTKQYMYADDGRRLERRARIAEEKLRIALKLIDTLQPAQNTNIIDYIDIVLEEIEGVGHEQTAT